MQELKKLLSETPGIIMAALGLGACLVLREANVLSASANIPAEQDASVFFFSIVIMSILMALVYRKYPSFRLHRHPIVAAFIAALLSLSAVLSFGSLATKVDPACVIFFNTVFQVGATFLILMWGEMLFPYGAKRIVYIFAISCGIAALLVVLLALIKTDIEYGVIAMLPILSLICLYYFKEYNSSRNGFATTDCVDTLRTRVASPFSFSGFDTNKAKWLFTSFVMLTFFFYRFSVGKASYTWIHVLGGSGATLSSQISNALGMLIAGFLMIIFIRFFWHAHNLGTYEMLVFVILALTLYITLIVHDRYVPILIVPLNIGQKLITLPILLAPYIFSTMHKGSPFVIEVLLLGLCSFGTGCYSIASLFFSETICSTLVGISLSLFLVSVFVLIYYDQKATYATYADAEDEGEEQIGGTREREHNRAVINAITSTFQLTHREEDILALLVERYTAANIAEILVVTMATAKTHMRNIYAKLDVHSQKELIGLYHEFEGMIDKQ